MTDEPKHQFIHVRSGEGFREKITPTCKCGWVGQGYEAYNNWQLTMIAQEEKRHEKEVGHCIHHRGY